MIFPRSMRIGLIMVFAGFLQIMQPAKADCDIGACLGIGSTLATIDSSDGPLLNLLTQLLLDSSVAITVSNWEGVAQTDVNLLGLLNAVELQAGVGSTEEALLANISLLDFLGATVTALQNEGDVAGAAIIEALRVDLLAVPDMNGEIQLGNLVTLADTEAALLDIDINVFHLLFGSLQLFNSDNTLDTPQAITVTTGPLLSALGLGSLASEAQVSLRITEPPSFHCGPLGVTVESANVRLKLDLELLSGFDLSSSALGSLLEVSLAQLSVYLELAPSEATLTGITPSDADSGSASVSVTHGIARLFLGQFVDDDFFDPGFSLPANAGIYDDLSPAVIGELSLLGSSADVLVRSYAEGTQSTSGLVFSTFPDTQTVDSSVGVIGTLISETVTNLDVSIDGSGLLSVLSLLGIVLNDVVDVVAPLVASLLDGQILSPLLTDTVDYLLDLLGVSIGKATVFVSGFAGNCSVSGRIYEDNNPANAQPDGAENWNQGRPVWIHALQSGQLIASKHIIPGSGSFSFSGLPLGDYDFILSPEPGVTSATVPDNWVAIAPVSLHYTRSLISSSVADINFGLRKALLQILGRVFLDTGVSSGTANDGIQNGGETAAPNEIVELISVADGEIITTAETDADGDYHLATADSWLNQPLSIALGSQHERIITGIAAGNSGGSYDSASERLNLTPVTGDISGITLGLVPKSRMLSDLEVVSGPGQALLLPHRFTAGSAGVLTLAEAASNSLPAGWNAVIYTDTNCDQQLNVGETMLSSSVPLQAGDSFCALVKVFVAASATEGATAQWNLSASYVLNGALTEQLSNHDRVVVTQGYQGALQLVKAVDKSSAQPGETLSYTISYHNKGSLALSNLVIYDFTPAFTVFTSTECNSDLGGGLSSCVATSPASDATGELIWTFSGDLQAGATGSLQFDVTIDDNP